MKLKSKSSVLQNIISEVDQQLSAIPAHDWDGCPSQDSLEFDTWVDAIKDITVTDESGKVHKPFKECIAQILVHDEITNKQNNGEKDAKHISKNEK